MNTFELEDTSTPRYNDVRKNERLRQFSVIRQVKYIIKDIYIKICILLIPYITQTNIGNQ